MNTLTKMGMVGRVFKLKEPFILIGMRITRHIKLVLFN